MVYPLKALRDEGFEVVGFWYNPNIHPYLEYKKRLYEVRRLAQIEQFELIEDDRYNIKGFLKYILDESDGENRCVKCYRYRLERTVQASLEHNIEFFSTTLLYSKYQLHEKIKIIGEELEQRYGVKFLYRDFRKGWSKGLNLSRKYKLYRQQYCGCIFSEYERFFKTADRILEEYEWYPRRKKPKQN